MICATSWDGCDKITLARSPLPTTACCAPNAASRYSSANLSATVLPSPSPSASLAQHLQQELDETSRHLLHEREVVACLSALRNSIIAEDFKEEIPLLREPAEFLNASCVDTAARCGSSLDRRIDKDSVVCPSGDAHGSSSAGVGAGVGSSGEVIAAMREELRQLLGQMTAVLDQQQAVLDDLVSDCRAQQGEANQLALQTGSRLVELNAEKEACILKIDALVAEKEALAVDMQSLVSKNEALTSENDALVAEREARQQGMREREEALERGLREQEEAWESAQQTKEMADSSHIETLEHALQVFSVDARALVILHAQLLTLIHTLAQLQSRDQCAKELSADLEAEREVLLEEAQAGEKVRASLLVQLQAAESKRSGPALLSPPLSSTALVCLSVPVDYRLGVLMMAGMNWKN